jgi:enterochelin esterase-like enzyme
MYIARSDGKKTVKQSKSKLREENQPTKSQLEKSIDKEGIESFYQAVPIGHAKSMEWRKKLGGMLMKELGKPYDESKVPWTYPMSWQC